MNLVIYNAPEKHTQRVEESLMNNEELIQHLKDQNAHLLRKNAEMENYIHAIACCMTKNSKYHCTSCENCPYWQNRCHLRSRSEIELAAVMLINELEEL